MSEVPGSVPAVVFPSHSLMGAINVRRVAEECQSIVVELLPDSRDDGTSNPILAELPYLGCNYPPISTRLQEEGSVVLSIQVLADGTVGSFQVSTPARATRLNDAAVVIAQDKLQFTPATKGGRPVAATRQISLNFKITKPIRGTP